MPGSRRRASWPTSIPSGSRDGTRTRICGSGSETSGSRIDAACGRWVPRLRPWHRPDRPPARLFVAESCGMCREVGRWFEQRGARQLAIVPAESHPSGALTRITYEPGDGSRAARPASKRLPARSSTFTSAGRSLGWLLRLPVICQFAQLLADASGGEPRRIRPTAAHPSRAAMETPKPPRGVKPKAARSGGRGDDAVARR